MKLTTTLLGLTLASTPLMADTVGYMELEGGVLERQVMSSFFLSPDSPPTLRDVTATIDDAADAGLDGFVIRVRNLAMSRAQIEEVGHALQNLRDGGTRVHVFTEIYGPGELMLASYADETIVQSGGAVSLPGMYMQEMFVADALRMVGIEPDFIQVGDYKGASEMMANTEPSDPWNKNISQLLDSMYEQQTGQIAAGRDMSVEQLERAMESCFFATPQTAINEGVVDAAVDRLELNNHLEARYGEDFEWDRSYDPSPVADMPDFANMGFFEMFGAMMEMFNDVEASGGVDGDAIAVVHIDGAIVDGESSAGSLFGGSTVGSTTIRKALREIERDDDVKGVIVRINSPGGSAIASESIWLGLRRVADRKPVWVSVGSMAASGGYYIAVAGDQIYVDESSIVGSIGVVSGKLAMRGLFDKLNINVVARTRGPRGEIMGGLDPWTASDRALMRSKMVEVYDQFVGRVEAGREGIDISRTAEGRLFTGDKAIALNMADKIGGIDATIEDLASELGLSEYAVVDYPGPMSFEDTINAMIPFAAAQSQGPLSGANAGMLLREVVGPKHWPAVQDSLNAIMQMRQEPVLLTSPRTLIIP